MPAQGLELTRLRATVDTAALAERQVRLHVESGILRISREALAVLLFRKVAVQRIADGRITLHGTFPIGGFQVGADADVVPRITANGRLWVEVVSVRAGGFFPVPLAVVALGLRMAIGERLGLHFDEANRLLVDLAEIVRPAGILLPPPRTVRAADGVLEVEF